MQNIILTEHVDKCSLRVLSTSITCFTCVTSSIFSANSGEISYFSNTVLIIADFYPRNTWHRISRYLTTQVIWKTFNRSIWGDNYIVNRWRSITCFTCVTSSIFSANSGEISYFSNTVLIIADFYPRNTWHRISRYLTTQVIWKTFNRSIWGDNYIVNRWRICNLIDK